MEATCKYILDNQNVQYDDSADLIKLYKLASLELNLAPSQHTEQQFKQILGGAESVVNGLSSLRNKLSDAHAIGLKYSRPSSRHAVLCVNMAGAVSEYLISTYEMKVKMA
ncbi:abortive infection family protein [Proteiniclasticum sp. QWL-01]|uniref:abortive infection family protein n=1 Tax=Proteiniclasticum sp. QWL-01 TaxID=3036945 RepID=UPI0024115565|nr:abortive infection family protein [Proteiniclasticum sp. QWL-01]WFF73651.1 abortive infection family protein [Proteiniclasticum sp. QWL-01]